MIKIATNFYYASNTIWHLCDKKLPCPYIELRPLDSHCKRCNKKVNRKAKLLGLLLKCKNNKKPFRHLTWSLEEPIVHSTYYVLPSVTRKSSDVSYNPNTN